MEVYTTKSGIQFNTDNFLDGSDIGRDGAVYNKEAAYALKHSIFLVNCSFYIFNN
ncbi:hypothetical protein [Fonticella tunisiensis]|uniref:hypothetical protein n=1 Tax=Fonticella tunisiensis TaxID=1096341 RepID=UPI001A9B16E6|nr:hypothetical protein [Fonticella tunisiensis]